MILLGVIADMGIEMLNVIRDAIILKITVAGCAAMGMHLLKDLF